MRKTRHYGGPQLSSRQNKKSRHNKENELVSGWLFASEMIRRVTVTVTVIVTVKVTHCSLEKPPFFEFDHRAL